MSDINPSEPFDNIIDSASQMSPIICDSHNHNHVSDKSYPLDQVNYFRLLQDYGKPCTEEDKDKYNVFRHKIQRRVSP